jgi:hypothetical protein
VVRRVGYAENVVLSDLVIVAVMCRCVVALHRMRLKVIRLLTMPVVRSSLGQQLVLKKQL